MPPRLAWYIVTYQGLSKSLVDRNEACRLSSDKPETSTEHAHAHHVIVGMQSPIEAACLDSKRSRHVHAGPQGGLRGTGPRILCRPVAGVGSCLPGIHPEPSVDGGRKAYDKDQT